MNQRRLPDVGGGRAGSGAVVVVAGAWEVEVVVEGGAVVVGAVPVVGADTAVAGGCGAGFAGVCAGGRAAVGAVGGVDVAVNNAGIPITGAAHDLTEDDWDLELAINLKSVYLVSKALWPHFLERGGGSIVSTASIAGWANPSA